MTKETSSGLSTILNKRIGRRTVLKTAAAAGGALAVGFPLVNVARADSNVIRIGHIDSISGPRGAFGEATPWMIERVRAVTKNGLQIGGKNYTVEILSRDSQSDPNRSASLGSELVLRNNVDLLLLGEALSAGANEMCDQNGTPAINTIFQVEPFYAARGSNPEKGYPWTFLFGFAAADLVRNYLGMWNSLPTNKVVGSLYVDNETGQAFNGGIGGALKQAGYTEVKGGLFQVQTDDFSNQVSAFKAANTQILTGLMFPNHFITFLGQAVQANLRPEICTVAAAFLFPSGVNALGDRGDGMTTEVWWTPQWGTQSSLTGQTGPQLASGWQDSTGKQWTQPLGYSHALWEVGLAALKASGDPKNREAVRDAIRSLKLDTIIGSVNFRDSKLKSVAQTELAGGQWRKAKSGKYPYDLLITYNGTAPNIKVQAETQLLSKLS